MKWSGWIRNLDWMWSETRGLVFALGGGCLYTENHVYPDLTAWGGLVVEGEG